MKTYEYENAKLIKVSPPIEDHITEKTILTPETIKNRKQKVLENMKKENLDTIVIYADLEHGSNFEYLSGFLPRFEEGLLVIHKNGEIYYLLGNENLKLPSHAHHKGTVIHAPQFSLPNQPMYDSPNIKDLLRDAGIKENSHVGLVGWKNFTSTKEDNSQIFDLPYFIVEGLKHLVSEGTLKNSTALFIGDNGVRTCNNANEMVHYSFGTRLASKAILKAMSGIELEQSEMEIASHLDLFGQPKSVVTIAASGQRFENANLYPSRKQLKLGDTFSLTVGYKGGLQSRAGYICNDETELPTGSEDYLNRVVKPYFTAVCAWIENIRIGMKGEELYELISKLFPKEEFGWTLNPGHLIGNDEWMCSPIYENSKELLKSGMMLQIDIIPSIKGYAGTSAECGIALIDSNLREELRQQYPDFLDQCEKSKEYLEHELGITVSKDVLVLSNATLYLRPFLLNKECAMTFNKALKK